MTLKEEDLLLAEMVEKLANNGYEFEGNADAFDPDKFLEAVDAIALTDDTLAEGVGTWLKESALAIRGVDEAGQYGALPKGSHGGTGAEMRKWVKKATTKKLRRMAKRDPENAPTKRPIKGYAD